MSTRGTLIIKGERYYIRSDAYPSYAYKILRESVETAETLTPKKIIEKANKIAGFSWIQHKLKKGEKFGFPFEEYRWVVNLRDKTVGLDKQYQKRMHKQSEKFLKKHSELKKLIHHTRK